jgi:hypothetical protein
MRRRDFGKLLGATGLGATPLSADAAEPGAEPRVEDATGYGFGLPKLGIDSGASLLNAEREPLPDERTGAVWAGENAYADDADGNGDAVDYPAELQSPWSPPTGAPSASAGCS